MFIWGPTSPTPPVLTSSGGHQSGQYASYWNVILLYMFILAAFTTCSGKLFHMVTVLNLRAFCLNVLFDLCRYIFKSCSPSFCLHVTSGHIFRKDAAFLPYTRVFYLLLLYLPHFSISVNSLMPSVFLYRSFDYGSWHVHLFCTFASI